MAGSRRLEVRGAGCIPKRAERGLAVSAGPSRRWLGSPPSRYSPADSPPRPRLPPGPDHRPQYELRQPDSALTPKLCHWDERLPHTTHQTHDHHQGRRRLPRPGGGEERRHHLCEVETQKNAGLPGRGSEKEPPCQGRRLSLHEPGLQRRGGAPHRPEPCPRRVSVTRSERGKAVGLGPAGVSCPS